MRVARNFWIESNENCHYLAIWMIFEIITMQLPKVCFELPNIQKILEQCKNNESRYSYWAQGKFHQIVKILKWKDTYFWNFNKPSISIRVMRKRNSKCIKIPMEMSFSKLIWNSGQKHFTTEGARVLRLRDRLSRHKANGSTLKISRRKILSIFSI